MRNAMEPKCEDVLTSGAVTLQLGHGKSQVTITLMCLNSPQKPWVPFSLGNKPMIQIFNSLVLSQRTLYLAQHCPQPHRPCSIPPARGVCVPTPCMNCSLCLALLPLSPQGLLFPSSWQVFPSETAPSHHRALLLNSRKALGPSPLPFSFLSLLSVPLPLTHLLPGGLDLAAEQSIQQLCSIYLLSAYMCVWIKFVWWLHPNLELKLVWSLHNQLT